MQKNRIKADAEDIKTCFLKHVFFNFRFIFIFLFIPFDLPLFLLIFFISFSILYIMLSLFSVFIKIRIG